MNLTFTVTVAVTRESGKFVSKADIESKLIDALEAADPGSVEVDESVYSVESFEVEAK